LPAVAFADDGVLRLHDHTFNKDQTWSGTVVIDGVVQFAPEANLTIMPGTNVKFTKTDTDKDGIGENELYVQGSITANGTKDKPIVFTSAEEHKRPGDWGAVNIMVSEGRKNELSNCIIEYGYRGFHMHFSKATIKDSQLRNNYLGIQCQDSQLDVTGCTISGNRGALVFKDSKLLIKDCMLTNNYWGVRFLYGEAELTGNTVIGNMINGITFRETKVRASGNRLRGNRKGFSAEQAHVELSDNIVENSVESGIYLKHSTGSVSGNIITRNGNSGISIEDSDVKITDNEITDNSLYAIDNNGTMDVDARGNWWGTTDPALISGILFDRAKAQGLGAVEYSPAAQSPFRKRNPLWLN
jgi:parallel beta-helix repeat protein